MSSDEEFERRLGASLKLAASDVRSTPGLGAAVRRRHVRRTLAVRTAVVTPVAAAAVGVATVGLWPDATHHPTSTPAPVTTTGTSDATRLVDVAYVSGRTTSALADISKYVVHTRTVSNGFTTDIRTDPVTGRSRIDTVRTNGSRETSIAITPTADGGESAVVVDYPNRAWWTWANGPEPGQERGRAQTQSYEDPAKIAEALRDGTMQVVGAETLDGRNTLHLRLTFPPKGSVTQVLDLWVDETSYLPYRTTATVTGAPKQQSGYTVNYTWGPRTAESVAQLEVTPPAGFTKHAKPIEPKVSGTPKG